MAKKLTQEEFIKRCIKIHPLNDHDKTIYINNRSKITVICSIHGKFIQKARTYLRSRTDCPKCGRNSSISKQALTTKEFIKRSEMKFPNLIDYNKTKYVNVKTNVIMICKKCHENFKRNPYVHLGNIYHCPKCAKIGIYNKIRKTRKKFIEEANIIHDNFYNYDKFIYTNSETKGIIICPKHGNFLQSPHRHLRKKGCPICKRSKGEILIAKFLKLHHIKYEPQKTFKNLKGKTKCAYPRYDFYLPRMNICIEYDGEQHFNKGFLYDYNYKLLKFYDHKKSCYCWKNKIKLIRIPYYHKNKISFILEQAFNIHEKGTNHANRNA